MLEQIGISPTQLFGQLLLGFVNGSFYAVLSLGLAVIFGLLNIINFAHGAIYMLGAFTAWLLLHWFGVGYGAALIIAPLFLAICGILFERTLLRRLYDVDHLYGLLLTLGMALVLEGTLRWLFGSSGNPYPVPEELQGVWRLGFMVLPKYRVWVGGAALTLCLVTWLAIERTRLGAWLRAATEDPMLVQNFGINVPFLVTATFALGVALAGIAGVLAAPIYQVNAMMGSNLIIIVFAVVVIGGMGSIVGSIVTGVTLGLVEGLTKVFYPPASDIVIFVIMAIVLLVKPSGLFGKDIHS